MWPQRYLVVTVLIILSESVVNEVKICLRMLATMAALQNWKKKGDWPGVAFLKPLVNQKPHWYHGKKPKIYLNCF